LACCFFSSRRRHTRSKRDWSSDVCSSDLWVPGVSLPLSPPTNHRNNCSDAWVLCQILHSGRVTHNKVCAYCCSAVEQVCFLVTCCKPTTMCWLCLFVGVLVPVVLSHYSAFRCGLYIL